MEPRYDDGGGPNATWYAVNTPMMKNKRMEYSEHEMQVLAEMAGFCLMGLSMVKNEVEDVHANAWELLGRRIFEKANEVPKLAKLMTMHPDLRFPFFNEKYADTCFFSSVMDELRETFFWDELVTRLADQSLLRSLGVDKYDELSDDERQMRTHALEQAIWNEVMEHGVDRLSFILPPEES